MNPNFPKQQEYPSYIEKYLQWVDKEIDLVDQLEGQMLITMDLFKDFSEEQLSHRYKRDKWTLKEVLVHIIDDERIYAYRALRFARNDRTILPGFEQDEYIQYAEVEGRSIESILKEYITVRKATISLFENFSQSALRRFGHANGCYSSVRALGYHILGHELHHIELIKKHYAISSLI